MKKIARKLSLVASNHENLRKPAGRVDLFDSNLRDLCNKAYKIMKKHKGCGLAFPQLGISKQIAIIDSLNGPVCIINPEILDTFGGEMENHIEGCLSLAGKEFSVPRYKKLKVRYQDIYGKSHTVIVDGFSAEVFHHEFSHLQGLCIDQTGNSMFMV